VTAGGSTSAAFNITLSPFAPMIGSVDPNNPGAGMAQIFRLVSGKTVAMTAATPALPNDVLYVNAIGLGPTNPVVATGATAPSNPLATTTAAATVTIAGKPIAAAQAFLRPDQPAMYVVGFTMPAGIAAGNQNISVSIGGSTSNTLTIPVAVPPTGPVINTLENNYSYIRPGLPNYGIAQGSIFDIFGANLANTTSPLQSAPLKTSVSGVSASVTVNGTTTNVILYFVSPAQIVGILPSNTPAGTGTVTVTNNGQTSPAAPIRVVQSAFGILTLNGLGDGQAAAFDVNSSYLDFTNAVNPGDYIILWGTGVGPVPSGTDETVQQTAQDLTAVPISATIGGAQATVYYHGRSQYPGLDQVILIVPQNVSPGCFVSVIVRSGNMVSNQANIPVAASGRTCSEPTLGFTASDFQGLATTSSFTYASINIDKTILTVPANNGASTTSTITDSANAEFDSLPTGQFNAAALGTPSLGSCAVYSFSGDTQQVDNNLPGFLRLNAGAGINVAGPNGQAVLKQGGGGKYRGVIGGTNGQGATQPIFIPPAGGTFSFDNGAGGPDIGAFSTRITSGANGILTWTNEASLNTVDRNAGLTVTWSGAGSDSFVQVVGLVLTDATPFVGAEFICSVPASAGSYTVPPSVLLAMPAGGTAAQAAGTGLAVMQVFPGKVFTAPKLTAGVINATVTYEIPAVFK
jgi:uncharacterized protein (TIGR03437 family)